MLLKNDMKMEATSRKQVEKGEGNLSLCRRHLSAGTWSSQETDQKGWRQETERKSKDKDKDAIAYVNKRRRNDHIQSERDNCMFTKPD